MKLIIGLLISVISIFVSGCNNNTNKTGHQEVTSTPSFVNKDAVKMRTLIDSAVNTGNENAYAQVSAFHILHGKEQDFLYCALIMANKYQSPMAYFHVYFIFTSAAPLNRKDAIIGLDPMTKNLAMYYLLKSYELGYTDAKFEVDDVFGKNITPPKSKDYLNVGIFR